MRERKGQKEGYRYSEDERDVVRERGGEIESERECESIT